MSTTPFPSLTLDPEMGFASGTRIHTKEGLKAIESIGVGDWVLTHPEHTPPPRRRRQSGEYQYRRVTRTAGVDVQSPVRISLQNLADGIEDSLLVAPGQPIWTQPDGWMAASQLRTGLALVLSFNGNAMVQKVQTSDQAARMYCLQVEDCNSYYVEQLGAWVGCSPDLAVQSAPVAATKPAFDFSKPQVVLEIKNYYNDTLAQPEPPKALASELAEKMRAAAEKLRSKFKEQMQKALDYDEAGVLWLEAYIERARQRPSSDEWRGAIHMMGAFLGECAIRNIGGHWSSHESMHCVVFDEKKAVFPHDKVAKQFKNGKEGGDSILSFYRAIKLVDKPVAVPASSSGAHFVPPLKSQPEMEHIITKLRASYAQRQQRMTAITMASLTGPRPPWLTETDALTEIFDRQQLLLSEGHIVWGALGQANSLLFKPGSGNSPASVVHSPDGYFDAHPQELRLVGRKFFALKGTNPTDPELKEVARQVTDEMNRAMGFEFPQVFSNKVVMCTTFMVFRQHIPNGVLSSGLFPILTHPSTQAVLMVPFEFWPIELIVLWKEQNL